jgi:hypothetical protein
MVITLSISELLPSTSTLLATLASGLLLFVTIGVIYLSAVDWQDKRRRRADQPRKR